MDNFRIHKQSAKQKSGSIDGFGPVTDRNNGLTKRFDRTYRSPQPENRSRTYDASFDRVEGFHRINQQSSGRDGGPQYGATYAAEAAMPSTVIEDLGPIETGEKRGFRLFGRNKNKAHKLKKNGKRRKITAKRAGIATLVVILLAGIGVGYLYLKIRGVFKGDAKGAAALQENPDPNLLNGEGDGRVNILILGKGGPTQSDGPDLTDTILLASIDPVQKEASLLSIPRDFWVKDNSGSGTKINAIYKFAKDRYYSQSRQNAKDDEGAERAGTRAVMSKVSEVLGVPMHYYLMVDFTAFEKAINTVGGITIDVKEPVREQMYLNGRNYNLNVGTGSQNFDGLRALAYARCRHCDARSDFGRSQRQREIIVALKDKLFSSGTYSNPYKMQQLVSTFGNNVRTDIGTDEISRLYEIGQQIPSNKIASVSFVDEPNVLVTTDQIGGQSVVVPKAGTFNYSAIQSFVRNNALRDSFLKNENAKIIILNGTKTPGLAGKTAEELRSYGYNVVKVENAPTQDYVNTYVVDLVNGQKKYTQSYLEKRMKVTATRQLTDASINSAGADFVIIIGQNEANRQQN